MISSDLRDFFYKLSTILEVTPKEIEDTYKSSFEFREAIIVLLIRGIL